MKRRDLLKSSLAIGAAGLIPGPVFAQPIAGNPRDRQLAAIAKRELAKAGDMVWRPDIVGIADFGLHSAEKRFHFVDLARGEVRSHYVTHGIGSDPDHDGWLHTFSNVVGSNATSRGAYITWEWYKGKYGTSIRLGGLDPTNSNVLERLIVMHHAPYAEPEHIARWGKLGRSDGCFAMGKADFHQALLQLSGGRLLFADRLGLAADGSTVVPPVDEQKLRILLPDDPSDAQRYNPGLF